MKKAWESIDLLMTETCDGIIVAQAGESYLARHWELSREVVSVIDVAISHDLNCLIRHSHPMRNKRLHVNNRGVEYIGFSQSPVDTWVFVLDQYSVKSKTNRREPSQVTFIKQYRGLIESAGVPFIDETGGGKNVFVPISGLHAALNACGRKERDSVEAARGSRDWKRAHAETHGITSEDMLEAWMMEEWERLPFGRRLKLVQNQVYANGYIDILARDSRVGAEVVLELKLNTADAGVIEEQLTRYVCHRRKYSSIVWGAVVARDFSAGAMIAARNVDFPIALYRFHDVPGDFTLKSVYDSWPYWQ